jgi:predicted transcriptional regulator
MPIDRFMEGSFASVIASEPARNVFMKFTATPYKAVLVFESPNSPLIGMITDADMAQVAENLAGNPTVWDAFGALLESRNLVAIRSTATLGELIGILNGANSLSRKLDIVPVVDQDNRPVGIIRRAYLIERLAYVDASIL